MTIQALLNGYKSKRFKPREIIQSYFQKIHDLQPNANSFIQITEELALEEIESLQDNQPLYGVPFSVKDCIDVRGYITTNGVLETNAVKKTEHASIFDKLERAGAICLGKTNLSEYATSVLLPSTSFGAVTNAQHPTFIPGGSSSGSAVAVAQGVSLFSIGTDTSGSTRIPAACNEIVGFKAPYKRALLHGVTPLSVTQDHIGILTKNIADLKKVLQSLDMVSTDTIKTVKKIGIPKGYFDTCLDAEVANSLEKVYQQFLQLGFELVELDTSFLQDTLAVTRTIGTKEFGREHMKGLGDNPHLSQTIKNTLQRSLEITDNLYNEALEIKEAWTRKFIQYFKQVDMIVTPTLPIVPPMLDITTITLNQKQHDVEELLVRCTSPFNVMGFPTVSLPSNIVHRDLKFSIQLTVLEEDINLLLDFANDVFEK
ncbi:amidase [Metasolibacillus fluoroglycofenilyticus]|uniref:amidase n=1 Tax=Metasolibacillus fluoroglycofenilyticus TaxID=1239396 RepID=UPI000D37062A|nr:amidase [Metasolibacillus fluoroglycofenilyticus]